MIESKAIYAVLSTLAVLSARVASKEEPSVIIVGAGAAGIAAAVKLLENGITNIVILEAEGRIGGRINSVEFGDGIVDLGAHACAGGGPSFIYNLVKTHDLLEPIDASKRIYQSPAGQQVDQAFTNELERVFGSIYRIAPESIPNNVSLGEFANTEYKKTIKNQYKAEPEKLKFATEFLDVLEKEYLIYGGGSSWHVKSAKAEIERPLIDKAFDWKGHGYKALLDYLMKPYPTIKDKIKLNKRVNKISWKNDISVQCSDGSVFKADHIILTVSLGVLKDNVNNLFDPNLPQEKVNAIKNIGICSGAKAFLHFPNRWWPADVFSIGFVWPNSETANTVINHLDHHPWTLGLYGLYTVKHNPNVLEAWFTGAEVQKIELFSDEEFLRGIMFALNTFFGKNVTQPDCVLRSKWYSNPNFRGTYSYDTVESYQSSDRKTLLEPLSAANGKLSLFFAGEATSLTCYGLVDGAVESGFEEAGRIIDMHK